MGRHTSATVRRCTYVIGYGRDNVHRYRRSILTIRGCARVRERNAQSKRLRRFALSYQTHIKHMPFVRLVRDISKQFDTNNHRFFTDALLVLQIASEQYIESIIQRFSNKH